MGHDIRNDLQVLQLLDFNLHTSIRGILDVGRIASKIPPNISMTLSSILSELRCPSPNLHTTGNDAFFTLRVLLLLAIRDYPEEEVNSNHQEILSALKAIANVSIPRKSDPQSKNIKKKQRRLQRNRKHQFESWDIETQEQIRAERAARRVKKESKTVVSRIHPCSGSSLIGAATAARVGVGLCEGGGAAIKRYSEANYSSGQDKLSEKCIVWLRFTPSARKHTI